MTLLIHLRLCRRHSALNAARGSLCDGPDCSLIEYAYLQSSMTLKLVSWHDSQLKIDQVAEATGSELMAA